MLDRPRFWWRAVKRGTTSLNTWAGWFGLIVLVLGVAAGIAVPLVFHLSHWVTAVILLAAGIIFVAEGSYLEWYEARTELATAQRERDETRRELADARRTAVSASASLKPPPFEPRLCRVAVAELAATTAQLIGVTNPAGQPERRARIYLDDMEDRPRNIMDSRYRPVIPYTVPPQGGGDPAAGDRDPARARKILGHRLYRDRRRREHERGRVRGPRPAVARSAVAARP
jgi:hypothetical protein